MLFSSFVFLIVLVLGTLERVSSQKQASNHLILTSEAFSKDYYLGNVGNKLMTYVALGASTAAGTGAEQVEQTYPYLIASHFARRGFRVHVINLARNGATLEQIVRVQLPLVAEFRPDLLTVSAGANDASRGTPLNQFRDQAHQLADGLVRTRASLVLMSNTPDLGRLPGIPRLLRPVARWRAQSQNAILATILSQYSIQVVDVYGGLTVGSARPKEWYAADGLHPSASGYERWIHLFIAQTNEETF